MIWQQAMYASGSTWMHNAAMKVAEALYPDRIVYGRFISMGDSVKVLNDNREYTVVKTHHSLEQSTIDYLTEHADLLLVTTRDPVAALESLIKYHGYTREQAIHKIESADETCKLVQKNPKAIPCRYEDEFTTNPQTINWIAECLGGRLDQKVSKNIFDSLQRPMIDALIAAFPPGVDFDPITLWQRVHAGRNDS
jgi:hypothetical protein